MNLSHGAIARLQWGLLKKHERNSVMTIIHIGQVVFYTNATILWKYLRIEIKLLLLECYIFHTWGQTQSLHVSYEVMVDTIYMCCSGMCHQHKFATQSGQTSPKYAEQVHTALCDCISKCWQVHKLNMHIPCLSRATKALHSDPQL